MEIEEFLERERLIEEGVQIGDYVRTWFGIKRVDRINENATINRYLYKNEVRNRSKNIIDLIEKGDVIDYYSNCLGTHIKTEVVNVVKDKEDYKWGEGYCTTSIDEHIRISDIKTILTKEQYMNNCYVVKE